MIDSQLETKRATHSTSLVSFRPPHCRASFRTSQSDLAGAFYARGLKMQGLGDAVHLSTKQLLPLVSKLHLRTRLNGDSLGPSGLKDRAVHWSICYQGSFQA